jgi:SAM-dependent methyltransferase
MISYGPLAKWYDALTADVPYEAFADFYEGEFRRSGGEFAMLLDLCCGTGTLTGIMGRRGYEMIAADASEDMLMQARDKCPQLAVPPLWLCQEAAQLDLYGTVDAAYCSLDGMDYIPPEELPEVFRRLRLFIRPEGLFIFDVRSPESFRALDGQVFVDETEDLLCLWRADFDGDEGVMRYGMDIFSREGELWRRDGEEHVEYAHEPETLISLLEKAGFTDCTLRSDGPQSGDGRLFITAVRGK